MHFALGKRGLTMLLVCAVAAACVGSEQGEPADDEHESIHVDVNVYALQWLVERIGGEYVEVALLGHSHGEIAEDEGHEGEEVHEDEEGHGSEEGHEGEEDHEGEGGDADLQLFVGVFTPESEARLANDPTIADITRDVDLAWLDTNGEPIEWGDPGTAAVDPHFWLDPDRTQVAAEWVAERLRGAYRFDGAQSIRRETTREEYESDLQDGLAGVLAELQSASAQMSAHLSGCVDGVIVPEHPSYGYLADRYELVQFAVTKPGGGRLDESDERDRIRELELLQDDNRTLAFFYSGDTTQQTSELNGFAAATDALDGVPDYLLSLEGSPPWLAADGQTELVDFGPALVENASVLQSAMGC